VRGNYRFKFGRGAIASYLYYYLFLTHSLFLSLSLSCFLISFFPFFAKSYSFSYPCLLSPLCFLFFSFFSQFLSHSFFSFHTFIHAHSAFLLIFCEKRSNSRNTNRVLFIPVVKIFTKHSGSRAKDCGESKTEFRLIKNYLFEACPVIPDK